MARIHARGLTLARFAIAIGPEQTEAPDIELGRQHASYTPVTWWDTPLAKDQSTEFRTKPKGEPVRLAGSQKPKFASLSKLFGEHSFNLQSHLPGLDYLARKARLKGEASLSRGMLIWMQPNCGVSTKK